MFLICLLQRSDDRVISDMRTEPPFINRWLKEHDSCPIFATFLVGEIEIIVYTIHFAQEIPNYSHFISDQISAEEGCRIPAGKAC
jgi:hypothetical protein